MHFWYGVCRYEHSRVEQSLQCTTKEIHISGYVEWHKITPINGGKCAKFISGVHS